MAAVLPTDDAERIESAVQRATAALEAGELVVLPTETVYGIAAMVTNDRAMEALERYKNRPAQPFSLHVGDPGAVGVFADLADPVLARLAKKLLPGPVTLVADVPASTREECRDHFGLEPHQLERLYHQGTIGIRCPQDRIAQRVLSGVSGPVVASSANLRGESPPRDGAEAARAAGEAASVVVDGGATRYARPSTVVRVHAASTDSPRWSVQREGVYEARMIQKVLPWTLLVVCSGNTCRSPMAAVIARHLLDREHASAVGEIGHRVLSAGTSAEPGVSAPPEAVAVASERGGDLTTHRSRPFSAEMAHEADLILCMTDRHRADVVASAPAAESKTRCLDPAGDIPDPVGSGRDAYERCAEQIEAGLRKRLAEALEKG